MAAAAPPAATQHHNHHPYHPTRLRQIALVTYDLTRAKHLLTTVFQSPVIFEDPAVAQWGLANFLMPLGGDIIEVVAPFKPGTTAGRFLDRKGGEGGYMIIMQTGDAEARRREVEEEKNTAGDDGRRRKVIFAHEFTFVYPEWGGGIRDEGWCVQYHPKGMAGGMMPELDSHRVSVRNADPLGERFSPWHACGRDYGRYSKGMREAGRLWLSGCVLRVGEGVEAAVTQWSGLFGIESRKGKELMFTNCAMGFVQGEKAEKAGLVSVRVGVEGRSRMESIVERAKKEGVWKGEYIEMVGVRWYLVSMEDRKAHI